MSGLDLYFLLGVVIAAASAIFNARLVVKMKEQAPELFLALGRPSLFHFAGIGWMTNSKYSDYFWGAGRDSVKAAGLWHELVAARASVVLFFLYFAGFPFVLSA